MNTYYRLPFRGLAVLSFFIFSVSPFVHAQQGMGVGNANPQEMLDVSGAIKLGTDIVNSNAAPTGGAGTIRFRAGTFQGWDGTSWIPLGGGGSDTDWTISGNNQYSGVTGNVGIGTSSPSRKLQVDISNSGFNLPLLLHNDNGTVGGENGIGIGFISESGGEWPKAAIYHERTAGFGVGKLHFALNNTSDNSEVTLGDTRMTITPNGNVGIGTTTPSDKLHVAGAIRMVDGNQAAGYIPVSDANGTMT